MSQSVTLSPPPDPEVLQDKPEDELLYVSLRAKLWDDFHGQEQVKTALQIAIRAAKERTEALEHILLYGPPGLGKTTLAHLIAQELGSQVRVTSGTALTKAGDLAAILTNLQPGDVLFIDEIHRLPKAVEETLYPAMEDFALDIVIGKGPSARTLRIDVPKFTLVGATTRFGALAGPFRDRFGMVHRMQYYQEDQLVDILYRAAQTLGIALDSESAHLVARRGRGTPRIALKLLKRVRDFAQVRHNNAVSVDVVQKALDLLAVDQLGLDDMDRRFLLMLVEKHQGGPVGLTTIAASLGEDAGTVEEVLEPYLLQVGLIKRTPKGRTATPMAYQHFGLPVPEEK